MPFGRGWFGRGGRWGGWWGRGNPYPFCRFYPWLPWRRWAYGGGFHPLMAPGVYPARGLGAAWWPYSPAVWGYPRR